MAKTEKTTKATNRNMRSKKDGSVLNANHVTLEATRKDQSHIDQTRFNQNAYWRFETDGKVTLVKGGSGGFNATKHEIKRYKELFGEGQEAKNERYIKNRNKKNCRTIEELYRNPKTAPLESLWQIGNSKTENMTTHEMRVAVFKAWSETVKELKQKWGENLKFLDAGLHMEEQVPHIHSRLVLGAKDEYGYFMPNQTQAFKEMGIERPDPNKPRSRYNNELIAFSDTVREMFYQNCEKQGLTIDREVRSASHRQKELLEYQVEHLLKEVEKHREVSRATQEALEKTLGNINSLNGQIKALEAVKAALEKDKAVLEAEKDMLNKDKKYLEKKVSELESAQSILAKENSSLREENRHLRSEKQKLEKERDTAKLEKEVAFDAMEKTEEYQRGFYKASKSITPKKYGTIPAQKEKKNLRGQVVQESRPECTIISTEDLEKLEEQARYKAIVDYNKETVAKIAATISTDDVIQELRVQHQRDQMEINRKNLELEKKSKTIRNHEFFLQRNGLEAAFDSQLQQQHQEHGHHHHHRF